MAEDRTSFCRPRHTYFHRSCLRHKEPRVFAQPRNLILHVKAARAQSALSRLADYCYPSDVVPRRPSWIMGVPLSNLKNCRVAGLPKLLRREVSSLTGQHTFTVFRMDSISASSSLGKSVFVEDFPPLEPSRRRLKSRGPNKEKGSLRVLSPELQCDRNVTNILPGPGVAHNRSCFIAFFRKVRVSLSCSNSAVLDRPGELRVFEFPAISFATSP